MKFLFSSSDIDAVENFARRLKDTGIAYDLQYPYVMDRTELHCYPELWIQHDRDFQTATLLLGSRGRARA